jgi:hypothetical protein
MKYSFSIENRFGERLRVDDAHSFDEAVHQVEKGVYERDMQLARRLHAQGNQLPPDLHAKLVAAGEIPQVPEDPGPAPELPPQVPPPTAKEKAQQPAPEKTPGTDVPDVVIPLDADGKPIPPETLEQVNK